MLIGYSFTNGMLRNKKKALTHEGLKISLFGGGDQREQALSYINWCVASIPIFDTCILFY
jgi:hypothetical protein